VKLDVNTPWPPVPLDGSVEIAVRAELNCLPHWENAFSGQRKDRRFYEIVEDTLTEGFEYRYFVIKDAQGRPFSVQPFFILHQDLTAGLPAKVRVLIDPVRRLLPRFMTLKTLIVGCAAGEGHLDGKEAVHGLHARLLASTIVAHARRLGARLILLKEFPVKYRGTLSIFLQHGFARVPSLPMTRLNIDYPNFEEYMKHALNSATRTKLRRKFRVTEQAAPIEMSVFRDVSPIIDDVYPLYLQVYNRSKLHFEKLTKAFFCSLGHLMPDKVRFFVWRQGTQIVAFSLCMVDGDAIYAEYIGLDYAVALQLHLYHYAVRDMISWAMAQGYKWLRSSGLNYDPKLHLRHQLDPIDLYVRHTSSIANIALRAILPLIEPTRYDPVLKKFANYKDLWE
jgi:hypothetical protein